MTEQEWLECIDPLIMMSAIFGSNAASERKLRLFVVACCCRYWHSLEDECIRTALGIIEEYADGNATEGELRIASQAAWGIINQFEDEGIPDPYRSIAFEAVAFASSDTGLYFAVRDALCYLQNISGGLSSGTAFPQGAL